MAAENLTTGTGLTGAIQKYLIKKLLTDVPYETPLANSRYAVKATLPKSNGQYVEYRYFDRISKPSYVNEGTDPNSGQVLTSSVIQQPIKEIADYISVSNLEVETDWIDFLDRAYKELRIALLRMMHYITQDRMLNAYSETVYGVAFTGSAFPTIYANNRANYVDLDAGDFITMDDIRRGRSRLANMEPAVPDFDGFYPCICGNATIQQLMEDDRFYDVVKRHGDLTKETIIPGHICDFEGVRFIKQSEPWRESIGGSEGTYAASGEIYACHMFGQEAFGYLQMSGKNAKKPTFKVQDITKTGCEKTIGYRVPFTCRTIKYLHGVNIKGTSKYSEANDD